MPRTRRIQGPDGQEHEAEPIGFRTSGEHFNEYLLDDGTVLRIKLVLTEVFKVKDAYDRDGNPAYLARHSQVIVVDSPDHLRGGGEASG
jgi:hypothetical protein